MDDQTFTPPTAPTPDVFVLTQEITLTRQDVVDALTVAVLARANHLSRLGTTRMRSLELDAQVNTNGTEIAGVVATVEARIDPAVVSALALTLPAVTAGRSPPPAETT